MFCEELERNVDAHRTVLRWCWCLFVVSEWSYESSFVVSECSDVFFCLFSAGHKTVLKRLNDSHASVLHDIRCIVICGEVLFVCCDVFCMGCVGINNSSHKTHVEKHKLILFSEFVQHSHSLISPLVWFANVETFMNIFCLFGITNQNSQIPYPKQYLIQNLLTRHAKASWNRFEIHAFWNRFETPNPQSVWKPFWDTWILKASWDTRCLETSR
jgi:hypothetical protein